MNQQAWTVLGSIMTLAAMLMGPGCTPQPDAAPDGTDDAARAEDAPPPVPREFRAVWVATVANIDWPSKPGLPVEQQRQEMAAILDKCVELNLNAVIFQVRPAADALYASDLEPWSPYLTGEMGKAPEPYYDPLEEWVAEAHARGLELHAWFNPYRALHPAGGDQVTDDHISRTHPDHVHRYGPYLWMDPASPELQEHSLAVFLDVAERYDVDGIHIDDYFYPYQVRDDQGNLVDFPDDATWAAYRAGGGTLDRSDWRREQVNTFVRELYTRLKLRRPHVKFGISPFGIWRPGNPPQIKGFDQYEGLYADARKWLRQGWVDYYTPQLYWEIAKPDQSFPVLLRWWTRQNPYNRHLWPGLGTYKTNPDRSGGFGPNEIRYQIEWARLTEGATGHVHFSMKTLMNDQGGVASTLAETVYRQPALVPASPWLDSDPPAPPTGRIRHVARNQLQLKLEPDSLTDARVWVAWFKRGQTWGYGIAPAARTDASFDLPGSGELTHVAVFAVDRNGLASPFTWLKRPEEK